MPVPTRARSKYDWNCKPNGFNALSRMPTLGIELGRREPRASPPSTQYRWSWPKFKALRIHPICAGTRLSLRASRSTSNFWWLHLDRHSLAWARLRGRFSRR
eukprot:8860088-Pyramimonas_sp.AAC.1